MEEQPLGRNRIAPSIWDIDLHFSFLDLYLMAKIF